jgi:hypothetical protein
MSRSRLIDDRARAQLRDRQLVLDSDDQVAALLALRNSVRRLETKVAELQLKLSDMPASFPPPKAAEKPAAPPPASAAPAPRAAEPPEPAPAPAPVAKADVTPAPATVGEPPPAPAPAAIAEPAPAPVVKPAPASPPAAKPAAARGDWTGYLWWALVFVLFGLAALLAWRLARRRRESFEHGEVAPEDERIVVAEEPPREEPGFEAEPVEVPAAPRREIESDADLATRLPGENTDDLRRRYIEERFPEIANRTIVLDDADSVVKGARLFYEDGAIARSVELLQYSIERNPAELKTWLALFEIFRLERLTGEFAGLARRFKEPHGKGDYWRKVQYFGREIDPGNTLYQEDVVNSFETIGPSEARRLAAVGATVDPIAENWLGAPMDFENEVFANELRKTLMAEARINEQDLVPNPMPALRNVEMFTVA